MSRDSYEILHEHIHGWLHRKNIASSVRRVSTLPVAIATDIGLVRKENLAYGFIRIPNQPQVFFHYDSVYGSKPVSNDKVIFSKFLGGGHDRAHPVIKAK